MNVDHGNLQFYPHLVSEQSLIEPVLIDNFASAYPSIVNFYSEKFFPSNFSNFPFRTFFDPKVSTYLGKFGIKSRFKEMAVYDFYNSKFYNEYSYDSLFGEKSGNPIPFFSFEF